MNPLIDTIVFGSFLLFFIIGWMKGFVRTVIGPIALVFGSMIAWLYYKQTQNFLATLLISLIAPFIIQFAVLTVLKIYRASHDDKKDDFTIGKILGGCLNLIWGGGLLILTILLVLLIPQTWDSFRWLQTEIKSSLTYFLLDSVSGHRLSQGNKKIEQTLEMLGSPEKMQSVQNSDEYQAIIDNEKIQAIFNDEELVKDIENKNFTKLITDPKITAIMQDPELMKKMLGLYTNITTSPSPATTSKPRIINVK